MSTRNKLFTGAFAVSLGLVLVMGSQVSARANREMRHGLFGMGFRMGMIEEFASELGLEAETLNKVKELAYQVEKETVQLRAEIKEAYIELRRLMKSDNLDKDKVMKQVEQAGMLEIELKKNHVRLLLSIRELLTPEQREKMKQLIRKHKRDHQRKPRHRLP